MSLGLSEGNPLMDFLIDIDPKLFVGVKVAVMLGVSVSLYLRGSFKTLDFCIAAMAAVTIWNLFNTLMFLTGGYLV